MIEARSDGEYRQPCLCVSRRRLATRRAKRLREQAAEAMTDAEIAEREEPADTPYFRGLALEYLTQARAIVREARAAHPPCSVCRSGEVIGNGTYGGPAHRRYQVVAVL